MFFTSFESADDQMDRVRMVLVVRLDLVSFDPILPLAARREGAALHLLILTNRVGQSCAQLCAVVRAVNISIISRCLIGWLRNCALTKDDDRSAAVPTTEVSTIVRF